MTPERRVVFFQMVEAGGIEPPSEGPEREGTPRSAHSQSLRRGAGTGKPPVSASGKCRESNRHGIPQVHDRPRIPGCGRHRGARGCLIRQPVQIDCWQLFKEPDYRGGARRAPSSPNHPRRTHIAPTGENTGKGYFLPSDREMSRSGWASPLIRMAEILTVPFPSKMR